MLVPTHGLLESARGDCSKSGSLKVVLPSVLKALYLLVFICLHTHYSPRNSSLGFTSNFNSTFAKDRSTYLTLATYRLTPPYQSFTQPYPPNRLKASKLVKHSLSNMPSKDSIKSTYPRDAQVLRIPASGSKLKILLVDTVTEDKTECKTIDARTTILEDRLGHTPDLYFFHERGMIDLEYLSLFDKEPWVLGSAASKLFGPNDLYYIYKCVTETPARLPRNSHLEKFEEGRAYGDAFVFKVRYLKEFHGEEKAVFGSMNWFLEDFKQRGDAVEMLKEMARW